MHLKISTVKLQQFLRKMFCREKFKSSDQQRFTSSWILNRQPWSTLQNQRNKPSGEKQGAFIYSLLIISRTVLLFYFEFVCLNSSVVWSVFCVFTLKHTPSQRFATGVPAGFEPTTSYFEIAFLIQLAVFSADG